MHPQNLKLTHYDSFLIPCHHFFFPPQGFKRHKSCFLVVLSHNGRSGSRVRDPAGDNLHQGERERDGIKLSCFQIGGGKKKNNNNKAVG